MSFLTKQFDGLGLGDSKRDEPQQGSQDYGFYGPGQAGSPPAQFYAAPPQPAYQPPSDKPPLPPGWTPLFDQELQRWYYAQDATGRTQWEAPGFESGDMRRPGDDAHGVYAQDEGYNDHGGHHAPPGYGGQAYQEHEGKGGGAGGALLGAAGGLAAGALGGAVLSHAMSGSGSDDINAHSRPVPAGAYGAPLSPADADSDSSSASSSDRDEVKEARHRYHEALAAADDSDAGSSEEEALEEAREEYYQECEDTYGGEDDDDDDDDDDD